MAAPLRSFVLRINHLNSGPLSCNYVYQKRWHGRRKLIYKPDGAHHVPGIPVHPDRKFPTVDPDDFAAEAEYPPVKPKFPPGYWGKTTREYAWLWHSLKGKATDLQTSDERSKMFVNKTADVIILDPINEHPATLPFRQYVTKTHLIPSKSLPLHSDHDFVMNDGTAVSEKFQTLISKVKEAIRDHLLLEKEILMKESFDSSIKNNMKCNLLFRCISDTIINFFQNDFKHLQLCQYDEDVLVRSFWHRCGVESNDIKEGIEYSNLDEMIKLVSDMKQTVVSEIVFDAMLRSTFPLPQVEDRESNLSTSSLPNLPYKLSSYGHCHSQNYTLENVCAGHSTNRSYQNPVAGDPSEFGLVGFLSTWETQELELKYNKSVAANTRLAMGVSSCFTWLAAQAMNQGFSDLVDLSYPLVSQAVLSDGQNFSFLQYQLNTLALWQEDSVNPYVNLCWHTEEEPLYHSIEAGQVRELNDGVVQRLVEMFLCTPRPRGYHMKATLADREDTKTDFIPQKIVEEEIIEEEKYIL